MKRLRTLPIVGLLLFTLWSCSLSLAENAPITIAEIVASSGPFADMGGDCRRGFDLALDTYSTQGKIGAHQVRVLTGDSQGDGKASASEMHKLVEVNHAIAVLSHGSFSLMPMNPISKQLEVPLIGPIAHPSFLRENPYAYQAWPAVVHEVQLLLKLLHKQARRRLALISAESEYPQALREILQADAQRFGIEVVYDVELAPTENNFQTVVTRLRAEQSDAVLLNLTVSQFPPAARALRQQDFSGQVLGNVWALGAESSAEAANGMLDGLRFFLPPSGGPQLLEAAQAKWPDFRPASVFYVCFASMAFVAQALAHDPAVHNGPSLKRALDSLQSVTLPDTTVAVRDRLLQLELEERIYQNGKNEPVGTSAIFKNPNSYFRNAIPKI